MERSCFVSTVGGGVGVFEVIATQGDLSAHGEVEVVTQDRYDTLVAERLEDPDGGLTETEAGPQLGGGAVTPTVDRNRVPWFFALGGTVSLLVLVGLVVLRRRGKGARVGGDEVLRPQRDEFALPGYASPRASTQPPPASLPLHPKPARDDAPTQEVMPLPETVRIPAKPSPSPVETVPVAQPPVVLPRHCTHCRKTFTEDLSFCPDDGHALALGAAPRDGAAPPARVDAMRCPQCGRVGEGFCPLDGSPMVPAGTVAAPRVATTGAAHTCPTCGRNYPAYIDFCGEDGTPLRPG